MKFFCVYDNLYEEYQAPFVMKNENVAKIEFAKFVDDCVSKAPEKEKQATATRFTLFTFPELEYDKEVCVVRSVGQNAKCFTPLAIPLEADLQREVDNDE